MLYEMFPWVTETSSSVAELETVGYTTFN